MKHLFIARPGEFDNQDNRLSDAGMGQLQKLGSSIIDIIGNGSVRIISSDEPDCSQSMKRLAGGLRPVQAIEVIPYLRDFYQDRFPNTYAKSMEIIGARNSSDAMIIISNDRIIKPLVIYSIHKFLDKIGIDGNYRLGTGMHLNLEARTYEVVPRREW